MVTLRGMAALLEFQSTLPVWGATLSFCVGLAGFGISIHAPRVGSDPLLWHREANE